MKKIVSIICVLIVVMTISGCKVGLYMEDFENVQWNCSEMELEFTYGEQGPDLAVGTIVKDGETIEIVCLYFLTKVIWIYDKAKYEAPRADDEVVDPLLTGSYSIEGDIATVKITTDNLFNGEYLDKEIHLTKTPVE